MSGPRSLCLQMVAELDTLCNLPSASSGTPFSLLYPEWPWLTRVEAHPTGCWVWARAPDSHPS